MKMPKDDVLDALVTDLVADQVRRALQLGFRRDEVEAASTTAFMSSTRAGRPRGKREG